MITPTSEARINPDGTLYHDLKTKPQDIPKEVQTPVELKDSIVYRYRYRDVVKTVEVERELTWWQKTQMYGFWVALLVIVITYRKGIWSIIKRIASVSINRNFFQKFCRKYDIF